MEISPIIYAKSKYTNQTYLTFSGSQIFNIRIKGKVCSSVQSFRNKLVHNLSNKINSDKNFLYYELKQYFIAATYFSC